MYAGSWENLKRETMVVVAQLRLEDAVVFVGERIRCSLVLKNCDSVASEELSWGSSQLYCHCSYSQTKMGVPVPAAPKTAPVSGLFAFTPSKGVYVCVCMFYVCM